MTATQEQFALAPNGEQVDNAKVVYVNPGGLAVVEEPSGAQYPFTFDKIEGYRGEQPSKIGLIEGAVVRVVTTENRIVRVFISSKT